ncbi:hypothetical protein AB1E18_018051 [Capra hircus]
MKQGRSLFAEEAHGCTTSTALSPSEPLSTASSHGNEGPRSRHGEAAGREGAAQQVAACVLQAFSEGADPTSSPGALTACWLAQDGAWGPGTLEAPLCGPDRPCLLLRCVSQA